MKTSWTEWLSFDLLVRLVQQNPGIPVTDENFLKGIKVLNLAEASLAVIPEFIYQMENLEYLDLSDNYISGELDMSRLPSTLVSLELSGNDIETIKADSCTNSSLRYLSVGNNKLTRFPEGLENLVSLTNLDLSNNSIKTFEFTGNLPSNLHSIDMSNNIIEDVVVKGSQLNTCYNLSLKGNKLKELPVSILNDSKIKVLNVEDNDFNSWDFLVVASKKGIALSC